MGLCYESLKGCGAFDLNGVAEPCFEIPSGNDVQTVDPDALDATNKNEGSSKAHRAYFLRRYLNRYYKKKPDAVIFSDPKSVADTSLTESVRANIQKWFEV